MTLCLFEDDRVGSLAPLTLTRAAYDLRVGARTLLEAAVATFPPGRLILHTRAALAGMTAEEHPEADIRLAPDEGTLFVNGRWLVRPGDVVEAVRAAGRSGEARAFVQDDVLLALWHPSPPAGFVSRDAVTLAQAEGASEERVEGEALIAHLWDVVADLGARITHDAEALGGLGTQVGTIEDGVTVIEPGRVHLAGGAVIRAGAVVRADGGPVWIGPGAEVGENAVVVGPVSLGPKAVVKAAARVDESALGYRSKVGGEVHGSVVHSLSSKGHDGYLGNSALGRWCNLGAGTDTSNLKNDYGEVTMWDAQAGAFVPTGRQFLGLVMGDHSKCSIHTMFNTGTVVGVFCNLFGAGFPPRWVPSFAWGGAEGLAPYRAEKAFRVAQAVMARRERTLSDAERVRLTEIAEAAGLDAE
ncbi:putative sugar nucleotidyl transferase [Rubrivirga sp.]|uniref:putative sugar nucleotidyl transferase n=1 Tax=Rubrivirga sp. TaxID=1885344 RepID=UPI003B52B94B